MVGNSSYAGAISLQQRYTQNISWDGVRAITERKKLEHMEIISSLLVVDSTLANKSARAAYGTYGFDPMHADETTQNKIETRQARKQTYVFSFLPQS